MKRVKRLFHLVAMLTLVMAALIGCGQAQGTNGNADNKEQSSGEQAAEQLSGTIAIDGSSTVFPITEAVAEEFMAQHPGVQVTVGVSGTGGGFKKFTAGETQIANASRPIKDEEKQKAQQNNIKYVDFTVAIDGIAVVVNPQNDWVDHLTVEELKKIWEPNSKVKKWSDIRPNWPNAEIKLYGPGTDSGTFDYFTEEIVGEAKASRSDYTASEDDNVLVQGVAGDKYALGYFGYAYYVENKDKLKVVPIDGGNGPVTPSEETINKGTYKPLSRPLFIYVNADMLKQRKELQAFVKFYLENAQKLAPQVGYIAIPQNVHEENLKKFEEALAK